MQPAGAVARGVLLPAARVGRVCRCNAIGRPLGMYHPSDVVADLLLGSVVATIVYHHHTTDVYMPLQQQQQQHYWHHHRQQQQQQQQPQQQLKAKEKAAVVVGDVATITVDPPCFG